VASIWSIEAMQEILDIDARIRNITVESQSGYLYGWEDVCQNATGNCLEHPLLAMLKYNASEVQETKLNYPKHSIICYHVCPFRRPRFNDEEQDIMDTHAKIGYDMLRSSNRSLIS